MLLRVGMHVHAQSPIPFTLSLNLPSCTKLQCTLQLRGQIHSSYFISNTFTVYIEHGQILFNVCVYVYSTLMGITLLGVYTF
jgi:hypothetical protein